MSGSKGRVAAAPHRSISGNGRVWEQIARQYFVPWQDMTHIKTCYGLKSMRSIETHVHVITVSHVLVSCIHVR